MRKYWWWATVLCLVASGVAWWRWPHLQLARAERALRPFPAPHDFYWPGYEPGSPTATLPSRQEALATAAGAVEAAESRLGPTPRSLYLRGRLASLRGATAEAIRLTRLAALLDPHAADLQVAQGVSLAIRGSAENRAIDWASAANLLLEATFLPGFGALGYANLAEVAEQLPAPHAAAEYWRKAAALADAPQRSAFSEKAARAEAVWRTHAERIAQLEASRRMSREIPGSAEALLSLAMMNWIPQRATFAADLSNLAEDLRTQRQDPLLAEFLRSPPQSTADLALARAAQANHTGDYRTAAEAGELAAKSYAAAGNAAGEALAGVQASLGLRRTNRAKDCLAIAKATQRLSAARGFRWAALRAENEGIACRARERVLDVQAAREELAVRSQASGFLDLELRGASSLVEPSRGFTAPVESWDRAHRGLAVYWSSAMPAPLAVNFYTPLGLMAESFGYSRLAVLLFREATAAMEGHPNEWLRDAIRADFLRLDPVAALPGKITSEMESAAREIAAGQGAQALARLKNMTQGAAFPYRELDRYERMSLLPMMGRALWQQGDRPGALRHFRVLVDETSTRVSQLAGRRQRYASTHAIAPAWRQYTEAQLEAEGAVAALQTWQTFRTLPNPGQRVTLAAPPGEARLAVAMLPAGPVVWWSDAQGVAVERIPPAADLARRSQRFAALVASADSPLPAVTEEAEALHRLLLRPFESRLRGVRTLLVDPDGPLAVLPWAALRDAQGRSLLSQVAIVQTIGWGSPPQAPASQDWQPALVVAEPNVDPRDRARFPALVAARDEAENLRRIFPRNVYLSGADARVEALQSALTQHQLFHFAGHGVAHGGNGALVLAGEPPVGTRLITASEIADLDLRRLRLATLAACSSGAGEDRGAVNVESLVQAFLDAGTQQVLASRWNVDSRATSDVMQKFYMGLEAGAAPAKSLREASLAVAQSKPHPYYWAAFQLFGRP